REPIETLFSWIAFPDAWKQMPIIQISREDVKRQLGIDEKRNRFSPRELLQNYSLLQYAELLGKGSQATLSGGASMSREQELKRAIERIGLFHSVISGDAWALVPAAAPAPWKSITAQDPRAIELRKIFTELVNSFRNGDTMSFEKTSQILNDKIISLIQGWDEATARVVRAELVYNQSHPFRIAWILYLLGALAGVVGSSLAQGKGTPSVHWYKIMNASLLAGLCSHIFGIVLRCYVAGRPPVTNMYESINWVFLGVIVLAIILYSIQKQKIVLIVAGALSCFGLIVGDAAPVMMDPSIQPLVPVLRSNYWLTIHVLTITLGYSALTLTLGIADVALYQFYKNSKASLQLIEGLNQLTYRAMQFGVVLLAAGTILGGVWADYSWGRFWGWDPKEVWALIALLCYLAILHGRFAGWVGQFGYTAWTVVAFLSVLMAWYGVNFVLGAGLHSYGFSAGGKGWVLGFVLLQVGYVTAVALKRRKSQART
ncbi:MAG: cytochrome c biogenesis protein CcsA, partial [Bdellovibrionota bacterium]